MAWKVLVSDGRGFIVLYLGWVDSFIVALIRQYLGIKKKIQIFFLELACWFITFLFNFLKDYVKILN